MSDDCILVLVFFPCRVFVQLFADKNYMYPYSRRALVAVLFIRFENDTIAFEIDILALLDWIAEMQGERYFYRIFI